MNNTYIKNIIKNDCLIEHPIDYEQKIYILLDFLTKARDNMSNGFWFPDYYHLKQLYLYIENMKDTFNSDSIDKFNERVKLYETDQEKAELTKIANNFDEIIGNVYYECMYHLEYIDTQIEIVDKRDPNQNSTIFFIEKSESGIIEKYDIGENIYSLGSFHVEDYSFLFNETNYVQISCNICIDSVHTIIPLVHNKLNKKDCF